MNIKIDGNRVRTTSPYDVRIIRALNKLEGLKKWGINRSFSFENTPYNLEIWRQVFPDCKVESETPIPAEIMVDDGLFENAEYRPTFQYKTSPRDHQKRALEKIKNLKCSGLFMDVGTGKSWTAIALMGQRWCENKSDHVLLVAKNGVHAQWVDEEIPKHMSESVRHKAIIYSKTKRGEKEFDDLLRFDGLKIFSINVDALITANGEKKIMEFLKTANGRATMIVDESQDIKNGSASRTRAALKFGMLCRYRMIMTGTPIAKNVVDLFSQFKFLDDHILGHKYLTTFKSRYCVMRQTDFGEMVVGQKNIEELYRKVDPYIFRITSEEALDLPPKVYIQRHFMLHDDQLRLMTQLKQQFFADVSNGTASVKNAAALVTKLQQISCGYLPMDDGSVKKLPNPRMDELLRIIEQRTGKIIIWCRFNLDVENVLAELGPSAVSYYGKTSESMRERNKRDFLDPKSPIRFFVASPEAAGTGLNLQGVCRTNIYYSNSFNALARWQSEGRTWRDGTTGSVGYFDLIAKKSPDSRILANLKEKKSISDLTLDEYRKLISLEEAHHEVF